MAEELYATLKTNKGDIEIRLLPNHAPKTVKNFVGLATGERQWIDPNTGQPTNVSCTDLRGVLEAWVTIPGVRRTTSNASTP